MICWVLDCNSHIIAPISKFPTLYEKEFYLAGFSPWLKIFLGVASWKDSFLVLKKSPSISTINITSSIFLKFYFKFYLLERQNDRETGAGGRKGRDLPINRMWFAKWLIGSFDLQSKSGGERGPAFSSCFLTVCCYFKV